MLQQQQQQPKLKREFLSFLKRMGSVIGSEAGIETHAFEVVEKKETYEIRDYAAGTAIETDDADKKGFSKLAGYIGVMKKPENAKGEAIAMTAPVVSHKNTMRFILPKDAEAPEPTNPNVKVIKILACRAVVSTWYGSWDIKKAEGKKNELVDAATKDGLTLDLPAWEWRRFSPPWTIPAYKKNEVYVPVVPKS